MLDDGEDVAHIKAKPAASARARTGVRLRFRGRQRSEEGLRGGELVFCGPKKLSVCSASYALAELTKSPSQP
jgi:hypothetical protein